MNKNSITVGEFKKQLEGLEDDDILHLPGGLGFYRIRSAGDNEYMIEQNEPQMFYDDEFKKMNPYFKVAFMSAEDHGSDVADINGGSFDPTIKYKQTS